MNSNSFRTMLSPPSAGEERSSYDNGSSEKVEPITTKAKRGRKKKSDDAAIAKSEGHELTNQQQAQTTELLAGLDQQEKQLTAYLNYQQGQDYARLAIAARTAGMTDVLVDATIDRIEALKQNLKDNLTNHNPLAILDELGLNRPEEETQKLREKIKDFDPDEFNRFLL